MRTFNLRLQYTSQKHLCLRSLTPSSKSCNMVCLFKRSGFRKCFFLFHSCTAKFSVSFLTWQALISGCRSLKKHRFVTDEPICKTALTNDLRLAKSNMTWQFAVISSNRKCTLSGSVQVFGRKPGKLDRGHEVEAYWSACREQQQKQRTHRNTYKRQRNRSHLWGGSWVNWISKRKGTWMKKWTVKGCMGYWYCTLFRALESTAGCLMKLEGSRR